MRNYLYYRLKFGFLFFLLIIGLAKISVVCGQVVYWNEVNGPYGNPLRNSYGTDAMAYSNGFLYVPYFNDSVSGDNPVNGLFLGVWDGTNFVSHRVPDSLGGSDNGSTGTEINSICIDNFGNVYMAGAIANQYGKIVIKWNGSNFSSVGYGINGLNANSLVLSLACDSFGNLYAGGIFTDSIGNMYVSKWNGTSWNEISQGVPLQLDLGGVNINTQNNPVIWCYQNYVYAKGFCGTGCIYQWDGNTWEDIDSFGLLYAYVQDFCVAPSGRIYADLWSPGNVAVWDGNSWSYLPTPPYMTANPDAICIDLQENVYLSGPFVDQAGYSFVYKWNGSVWSELGTNNFALHANNYVGSIVAGGVDNIFAVGEFTDCRGNYYIAESNTLPPGRLFVYLSPTSANCGSTGSITSTVYQGTPPYTYAWSNGATTANIDSLATGQYFLTVTDVNGLIATGDIFVPGNCNSVISGTVFVDTAGNCIYNGQQTVIPNVILTLSGDSQTLYSTTDANGYYNFAVGDTGNYHLYIQVGNSATCGNLTLCGNINQVVHVGVLGDSVTGNNFALKPDSTSFDLYLHPGWTRANPGFEKNYWIYFANNTPVPFTGSATVAFKYDSNLVFLSSDTPYATYIPNADSIIWQVNSFTNYGWNYIGRIRFNVPSTLPLNYQLHSQFWIYPYAGDCDTSNNYLAYYETVKDSHDPNYKEVSPSGNTTDNDSILVYTIHYQNTGTDSTYFIIVIDTLSPYLNPATVQNLASSDSYSAFSVSGSDILTWVFSPLSLPAAAADSMGSKGFITYSVKKLSNLPAGVTINNRATVYFDYNTGVSTNTTADSQICFVDTFINIKICSGDSYSFKSGLLTASGTYYDTLTSSSGCDSLVILNLTVSIYNTNITQSICPGQIFNGHDSTGVYVDTFTSVNGCDSIVILNLSVKPKQITNLSDSICEGTGYIFNDTVRNLTNTYTAIYTGANGCDSISILDLTVLPNPVEPYITRQSDSLISNDLTGNQWYFNDTALGGDTTSVLVANQNGNYRVQVTGPNGCQNMSAEYAYVGTGIQMLQDNVSLYPNPNDGNFIIRFSDNISKEVVVMDIVGQTIIPSREVTIMAEFDLSKFAAGIYLLRITDAQNNKQIVFKQVAVQH